MKVIDLGCGTGEHTKAIAATLKDADVSGIDSSPEMLANAVSMENNQLHFYLRSIEEQLHLNEKYDLVFSNAAIQWVPDHENLLPKIIARLNDGGQLAIQMPAQQYNITNIILNELAAELPYQSALQDFLRISPVLDTERYASIFFENRAASMTVFEKIYPLILTDTEALYNWVSGTALIPYLEKLNADIKQDFISSYKKKLKKYFTGVPVFYPFKRILLHGQF